MPRKSLNTDPVAAFVIASQQFAQAKAKLQEAVRKHELTQDQEAYYDLLRDGFTPRKASRGKLEKEIVHESDSFKPLNENGAEAASTAQPRESSSV